MKLKRFAAVLVTGLLITSLTACGGGKGSSSGTQASGDGNTQAASNAGSEDYDFYIFNGKGESADALQKAADAYKAATGTKAKVFSLGSGTDSTELLRAEMNSDHMPTIFTVQNAQNLVEWVEGGFAMDLTQATDENFKKMAGDVPQNFYLTRDGSTNYGIPYNIEGYGYIADKNMLAALFGEDKVEDFIASYKTATYAEFEAMVLAIDDYIKNGTAADITLSGKTFTLLADKSEKAAKLKGVFSVAGAEKWTYGDHLINIAIDAVFKNSLDVANATKDQIEAGRGAWEAYAKLLDLKTSHAATARGPELINASTNGYDAAVATFANGEAVFIKQGNWCYTNITKANPEIGSTLTFLPIKLDVTQEDIKADGLTVDHLNSSIPVFVPMYYCINAKATDKEKAAAEAFLAWLNTTEEGLKFVVEDMAFIPYNADPEVTSAGYSLGDDILSYVKEGQTITDAYAGLPSGWATNVFGLQMLENYVNTEKWPDTAYSDIADFIINSWEEAAGLQ
ncbi:ABC transporter substrate-binding protein [Anaerocolumna sp. MB42-C2]|uniref:ABC transporter substrate-binding protein n=1 Tax=Anaerocolumna sp. MB42-C2 TaxID=3070997 RepID=UPI0027E0108A|nr:ABC transporter substrate-binding protein [Anaerocolumna sp. MB42-C2]WMJ85873.1 ABC transporter substrate-binding protein [Anaerocolumna sp. MB42-C2]